MKFQFNISFKLALTGMAILLTGQLLSQKGQSSTAIPEFECGSLEFRSRLDLVSRADCAINYECDEAQVRDGYIYDSAQPFTTIKTKARIVRDDNGNNPTISDRALALEYHHLNNDFAPYGIQFTYLIEYIDDSAMLTIDDDNELGFLFFNYASETDEYCNIFFTWYFSNLSLGFFPWQFASGQQIGHLGALMNTRAQVYPWNMRSTLTHEMGHVLGLEHTFRGAQEVPGCSDDCAENMISTGDDVGDWCSDTPPQDRTTNPGFNPTNDCNGLLFDTISHTNYMSYSDNKLFFTSQQVARMHCYLTHPLRSGWVDNSNPQIPYLYSDEFGYEFTEEANVDTSEWVDISTIGAEIIGLSDDNVSGPVDIGFAASFYGQIFEQIYIGSNGYISLSPININPSSGNSSQIFGNIPLQNANNNFFAPFLTDLRFGGTGNKGKAFVWSNNIDSFVVTYENVPFFDNALGFTGSNTFQMIYSKNALNPEGLIYYQYLDMEEYFPSHMHFRPNPILIGIENADGTIGLEVDNYRIPANFSRVTIKNNSTISSTASINDFNIIVYSNPSTNSSVTISFQNNFKDAEFQLFNSTGQLVTIIKESNMSFAEIPFRVPSGVYFLNVKIDNTYSEIIKLMKI